MLIATHNGQRQRATRGLRGQIGTCPWTDRPVKACAGEIRQYWAYIGGEPTFERGYEPESEWHLSWKYPVEDQFCERVFGDNREHRADIIGAGYDKNGNFRNYVIEIQKSQILIEDSKARTVFYNQLTGSRVIWVVNIENIWKRTLNLSSSPDRQGFYDVEWKPIRSWLWDLAKRTDSDLYLEFNPHNKHLLKMWVHQGNLKALFFSKEKFFMSYMNEVSKAEFRGFSQEAKDCLIKPTRGIFIPEPKLGF